MSGPRLTLCAALAAGCFLLATTAEARFGRGGSSQRASKGSRASERHEATPVRQQPEDRPSRPRSNLVPRAVWVAGVSTQAPRYVVLRRHRGWRESEREEPRPPLMVRLGVDAYAVTEGRALGLGLGLEGRRWGVSTRVTGLRLRADDGSEDTDHIELLEAHVTYAAYASERGRIRLEGGMAAARAPDVTFIGPSVAASFERCIFGALDLEGRVQWVPLPHLQLDAQLGLAVHMGVLTLRGGWRGLLLDDRGYVDGVRNRDRFGGPFAGVGLNF
ncbi:hypothetical protein [Archangium sp.]|uniref:hypothetical protein n=1 Tax=Archangium sp. TaxID=1872627 RepID=UPI00286C89E1|nr:hypothetical protein [Archangium sp.]